MKKLPILKQLSLAVAVLLLGACSNTEEQQLEQERTEAFNEYKTFVGETEARVNESANDMDRDWDREMTEWRAESIEREEAINQHLDQYDEQTRNEITELRARYQTAAQQQEDNYNRYKQFRQMRSDLLGLEQGSDGMENITAANIRATYERFVDQVEANKDTYSQEQWNHIEGLWSALDDRLEQLGDQIDASDKAAIAEEKAQYRALHTAQNVGNAVDNAGEAVNR